MSKIKIFTDSTADLSKEIFEKYNIGMMPLYVILGEKTYKDTVEVNATDIFEYVKKTGVLPKTAAVSAIDYQNAFAPYVEQGYDVISFSISSEFSSCYQNACIAAEELGHVYPVDSRNLSTGIGLLVLKAAELAEQGELSAKEIVDYVNEMSKRVDSSFVLSDLGFLYKGGRCSGVAALGANILKLKPCIEVVGGKMEVGKKYRGSYEKCVAEYITDKLANDETIDPTRIFFTWTAIDKSLLDSVLKQIEDLCYFEEILVTEAGSTISGHCGPNCLGVLFCHRND